LSSADARRAEVRVGAALIGGCSRRSLAFFSASLRSLRMSWQSSGVG